MRPAQPPDAMHDEIAKILEVGTRAINPYNIQPWRFKIAGDVLEIYIIRTKNFFLKLEGVFYMTLGALLENIREGAGFYGYEMNCEPFTEIAGLNSPCARVTFGKRPERSPGISHVLARATNRRIYSRDPLPAEVKEQLQVLEENENIKLLISEGPDRDYLAGVLSDLEYVRLFNHKLIAEVFNFIRYCPGEVQQYRDRLYIETLELPPIVVAYMKLVKSRLYLHELAKRFGFVHIAKLHQKKLLCGSGAIVTFLLRDRSFPRFVELGMVVQRAANLLAKHGLASMSVLSELYLFDVLSENPEIYSNQELRTLEKCRQLLSQFYGSPDRKAVYILRAGFAAPPTQRSNRKELKELILEPAS